MLKWCSKLSRFPLILLKRIFMLIITSIRHLLPMLDLLNKDVFSFLLRDFDINRRASLHTDSILIYTVMSRSGVLVILVFVG